MRKIYRIILIMIFSLAMYAQTFAETNNNILNGKSGILTVFIAIVAIIIGFMLIKKLFKLAVKAAIIAVIILLLINYQSILAIFS